MTDDIRESLRRLTIGDESTLTRLVGLAKDSGTSQSHEAISARLAALIATDAPEASYRAVLADTAPGRADLDYILTILVAVAEEAGSARVFAAAPRIAAASGYDIEADLDAPSLPVG